MENVARRGDRVGAVHHGELGPFGRRQDPPGQGAVPRDAPVEPRRHLRRLHPVALGEDLRRLAEVIPGLQRAVVRLCNRGVFGESPLDPLHGGLDRAVVDPRHQPESEEVLAPFLLFDVKGQPLERLHGEPRDIDLVQPIAALEGRVVQRVGLVARTIQVLLLEGRGVHDQQAAFFEIAQVHFEGRRVHGHQAVKAITRRIDPAAAELELVAGHPEQRAGGSANLRREVRQRDQIGASPRGLGGKLLTRHLHAVARVTGKPNHGAVELTAQLPDRGGLRDTLAHCRSSPLIRRLLGADA